MFDILVCFLCLWFIQLGLKVLIIDEYEQIRSFGLIFGIIIFLFALFLTHKYIPSFPNNNETWKYMFLTGLFLTIILIILFLLPKNYFAFFHGLITIPLIFSFIIGAANLTGAKFYFNEQNLECNNTKIK